MGIFSKAKLKLSPSKAILKTKTETKTEDTKETKLKNNVSKVQDRKTMMV
jgi:hypothetical protein